MIKFRGKTKYQHLSSPWLKSKVCIIQEKKKKKVLVLVKTNGKTVESFIPIAIFNEPGGPFS